MSQINRRIFSSTIVATVISVALASPVFAQTTAAPDSGSTMTKAEKRAANKQTRKANRAVKNAELSKLEKNGYSPGMDDATYPAQLQAAEAKAAK